ncbi:class I SAM-dependent methyltransferase [Rubricoccus marinus]|uniref:Methyltransferase small domain-containing protein n=1 Tax=Rubricoccus marinus TaxID=716817 RepID=A0A259TTZ9_9BACT|nr:class I SAM-dependent methyltransferase [Rubricoccus marinus]OZC01219.1 hypothetical protein BSZ36_18370 [Rubricoccus marinus]
MPHPATSPLALDAHVRLAREVEAYVAASKPLSSADLFALASSAYGGSLAEGAFTPRDAYDAAELGLHLHLLRAVGRLPPGASMECSSGARDALAEVERLSALLPSQTRRTAEQNDYQQFSTPAAYAGLCAWVSGVGEGHRVLEPSAGTGALCTFALASGASVHANELSDRRADLLAVLLEAADQDPGETLTRENADHLDAILPPSVRADVVLMNPPFSQTAGRLGTRRVPTVGTDHVLQALRRLEPGGRLVAVLSAAVQRGKPTHGAFFQTIDADPFILCADVEVGGAVYRPYGTSVRTRLLVVERMPEHSSGAARARVEGVVEAVPDVVDLLMPTRAGRSTRGGRRWP